MAGGGESWREAFPEVPTNELDAPGLWSDPNFSLSKSASIGKFWRKERERERKKSWSAASVVRDMGKRRRQEQESVRKAGALLEKLDAKRAATRRDALPLSLAPSMHLARSLDCFDIAAKERGAIQARSVPAK